MPFKASAYLIPFGKLCYSFIMLSTHPPFPSVGFPLEEVFSFLF